VNVRSVLSPATTTSVEYKGIIQSNVFVPERNVHYATNGSTVMKLDNNSTVIASTRLSFTIDDREACFFAPVILAVDGNGFLYAHYALQDTLDYKGRCKGFVEKFDSDLQLVGTYNIDLEYYKSTSDFAAGANGRMFIVLNSLGKSGIYKLDSSSAITDSVQTAEELMEIHPFNDTLMVVYGRAQVEKVCFFNDNLDSLGEVDVDGLMTTLRTTTEFGADTAIMVLRRFYPGHNGTIICSMDRGKFVFYDSDKNIIARFITGLEGDLIYTDNATVSYFHDGNLYKRTIDSG